MDWEKAEIQKNKYLWKLTKWWEDIEWDESSHVNGLLFSEKWKELDGK